MFHFRKTFHIFVPTTNVMLSRSDMKLYSKGGNSYRELVDFVNEHKIKKEDIVSMGETRDGLFMLIYFGEE